MVIYLLDKQIWMQFSTLCVITHCDMRKGMSYTKPRSNPECYNEKLGYQTSGNLLLDFL